ncbi:DUF3889 domain-containing protein [Paenibacillus ferrarius]|uniref:DUF3889 domain-containing protein n=1 Tax=Paenibacillus ferrarius TaxID=1469647 RepID=UPI003D2A6C20
MWKGGKLFMHTWMLMMVMLNLPGPGLLETAEKNPAVAVQTIGPGYTKQAPTPAPTLDPGYAKWSRIAFQEAGKVYTLLDYQYLGKSDVAPGVAQQQFRFWARHQGTEFPLIVTIRYDPVSERIYAILMEQQNLRGSLRML